jgi:hypothetical protein
MISLKLYFDGDLDTPLCEAHSYLDWHDIDDEIHTYTVDQTFPDTTDVIRKTLNFY